MYLQICVLVYLQAKQEEKTVKTVKPGRPSDYHLRLQEDKAAPLAGKAVFELLLFNVAQLYLTQVTQVRYNTAPPTATNRR